MSSSLSRNKKPDAWLRSNRKRGEKPSGDTDSRFPTASSSNNITRIPSSHYPTLSLAPLVLVRLATLVSSFHVSFSFHRLNPTRPLPDHLACRTLGFVTPVQRRLRCRPLQRCFLPFLLSNPRPTCPTSLPNFPLRPRRGHRRAPSQIRDHRPSCPLRHVRPRICPNPLFLKPQLPPIPLIPMLPPPVVMSSSMMKPINSTFRASPRCLRVRGRRLVRIPLHLHRNVDPPSIPIDLL